jgi:hypothetical protein
MDQTFDSSKAAALTETELVVGPRRVPRSSIHRFGVSAQSAYGEMVYTLHVSYRESGSKWLREITVALPGIESPLVDALRQALPGGWVGADNRIRTQNAIGISSARTFVIIFAGMAITILVIGLFVALFE